MSEEQVVVEPVAVEPAPVAPVAAEPAPLDYNAMLGNLPDEMGGHSSLSKYNSIEDLARAHINSSSLNSKKASEFWTSEDPQVVAERNSIMGVPADAAGYELVKPADFPADIPYDENHLSDFAAFAAENGMSKDLAEKLIQFDAGRASKVFESTQAITAEYKQGKIDELKKEWGTKFDYNDSKVSQIADHLGITEVLMDTGLSHEPAVLNMLLNQIGPAISNDKLIETTKQDSFATLQDGLDAIDSKIYNMDSSDPAYKSLLAERMAMLEKVS
jgi:hypothetical protein|tara:strand:+ start:39 stop:857 length:819 start_codon:yes stop_codon:yes gene_type:complete